MFGQTRKPNWASSRLIARKRLPVHKPRRPIGSPAVSSCSKERSRFRISGVFFPRPAGRPPARRTRPRSTWPLSNSRSAAGDSVRVQPEELRHPLFAAMAPLQTFQAGVESPLLFIQQTVKEGPGRLQVVAGALLSLPRGPLLLPPRSVQGAIQITALPLPAVEPPGLHQLAQGILGRHLHHRFQFVDNSPPEPWVTKAAAVFNNVP